MRSDNESEGTRVPMITIETCPGLWRNYRYERIEPPTVLIGASCMVGRSVAPTEKEKEEARTHFSGSPHAEEAFFLLSHLRAYNHGGGHLAADAARPGLRAEWGCVAVLYAHDRYCRGLGRVLVLIIHSAAHASGSRERWLFQ